MSAAFTHAEPPPPLWRDTLAAGVNALVTLALVLTLGLLTYAPLGAQAAAVGIAAGLAAVIFGGAVYALASRGALPLPGASSPTALVLAGLVVQLLADPALDASTPAGLAALLSVTAATVVLMGLLQMGMALLGLGRLVLFVPQPVLAGFMNGVAVMIVFRQLPPLLGLPALHGPGDLLNAQPLTLAIGAATAGAAWLAARHWPKLPSPLVGLACGTALCGLSLWLLPGANLGDVVGPLPPERLVPDALWPLTQAPAWSLLLRHGHAVVATAGVLALISALDTLLNAVAIDQLTRSRHDARRELLALGAANLVSGLWGGLPLALSRLRAMTLLNSGARGRRAALLVTPVLAAVALWGAPLLAPLPRTVLAGMMLALALALVDRWSSQLLRQLRRGERSTELRDSLVLVTVVAAVTIAFGFVAAVALGVVLSLGVFVRGLNRSLLRAQATAAERPSRRIYAPAQESWLQAQRRRITVLELEGALFFGTAERLSAQADTLPADLHTLVLDLRRVRSIDETGAVLLQQLSTRLRQRGVALLLAGVQADNAHGQRLRTYGCFREAERPDWWPDADRAVEAAEQALLAEAGQTAPAPAVALADSALMHGLTPDEQARVAMHLQPLQLTAGEWLFHRGDRGDRLFVLTAGSVSIVGGELSAVAAAATGPIKAPHGHRGPRYVSYSPGALFGETAMLDGGGRSAGAVADTDCTVHALTEDALAALAAADPPLGLRLMRNIALHLSQRLRGADWAWRAASA